LLEQRKRLQDDLASVQGSINEEFDRLMRQADEAPNRILAEIADSSRRNGNGRARRPPDRRRLSRTPLLVEAPGRGTSDERHPNQGAALSRATHNEPT
jgi:hypothetical protein